MSLSSTQLPGMTTDLHDDHVPKPANEQPQRPQGGPALDMEWATEELLSPRMQSSSDDVPFELSHVPQQVLEGYMRRRLLALAKDVATNLKCPREDISRALIQAMDIRHLNRKDSNPSQPVGAEWQLEFWHDCLNQGCPDMACHICAENPNRRCKGNFADRYLVGDVLKATCGAPIQVGLVNRATGELASKQEYAGFIFEVCILDGRAFARLEESGQHTSEVDVDGCMLLTNDEGGVLLATDSNGEHNELGMVLMDLYHIKGHPIIPGLNITGSSAALLAGQKSPFRLLIRARRRGTGARPPNIRFAVSEPFAVATQRTKTATKALIPRLSNPVGKLKGLGDMTVRKLLELGRHVSESKSSVLSDIPLRSASTVGAFKRLILWAEKVPQRMVELKMVLHLSQNYAEAREHAMMAVGEDNRMRLWSGVNGNANDDVRDAGALFSTNMGSINLDQPAALLEREGNAVKVTLPSYLDRRQKGVLGRVQEEAREHWKHKGHPNWSIWEFMAEKTLHRKVHSQVGTEGCLRLASSMFPEGALNPLLLDTHSCGGLPSFSDKGSSGLVDLHVLCDFSDCSTLREACGSDISPLLETPALSLQSADVGEDMLMEVDPFPLLPSPYVVDGKSQGSKGTPTSFSTSHGHGHSSIQNKRPLSSQSESRGDRHRTKRAHVREGQLQQVSTLEGKPLGDPELHALFSSFQMTGSAFSGVPIDAQVLQPIQQPDTAAMQEEQKLQAPPVSSPNASATTNPGPLQRSGESSAGSSNLGLDLSPSQAGIPEDCDIFGGFLSGDYELSPEDGALFESLFSG